VYSWSSWCSSNSTFPSAKRVSADRNQVWQRVGVHHHRDPGADAAQRLPLQQRHLPGEPDQRPAGLGRLGRFGPPHQHLPDGLFESLDPLADRGRRDVQGPSGGVEAALVDDGLKGRQLHQIHISDPNLR
jgi:hypothetical protein